MASVTYKGGTMTIGIEGLEDVAKELGVLRNKTPATVKVAINQTARQTRKLMIQRAKARYALLAAGRRHLNDLKQRKKATNADLSAELYVKSMRNDLGYFEHSPTTMFTGRAVANAPEYITARVLKSSPMKPLTDKEGKWSKGFLVRFANNGNEHIGMVQRLIGSYSEHTTTRSGAKRWTNKDGKVEKGEGMDCTVKLELTYLLIEVDGVTVVEIDKLNGKYVVNDEDMLAEINTLI